MHRLLPTDGGVLLHAFGVLLLKVFPLFCFGLCVHFLRFTFSDFKTTSRKHLLAGKSLPKKHPLIIASIRPSVLGVRPCQALPPAPSGSSRAMGLLHREPEERVASGRRDFRTAWEANEVRVGALQNMMRQPAGMEIVIHSSKSPNKTSRPVGIQAVRKPKK